MGYHYHLPLLFYYLMVYLIWLRLKGFASMIRLDRHSHRGRMGMRKTFRTVTVIL